MDFHSIQVPLVPGMSRAKIEKVASQFLTTVSPETLQSPQPTPLLHIFENKMDLFDFRVLIGPSVKGLGGFTDVTHRCITLCSSTYKALEKEDAKARFTVAHEIGHALLHGDYYAAVYTHRSQMRPFEDPEWQANSFAASLLMPLSSLQQLFLQNRMTTENVMKVYKVSWSAASRRILNLTQVFRERALNENTVPTTDI